MSKYLDYDGLSHFKDKCDDAYADTLGTGYVKAAFTPELDTGYGFSGFTQWAFNIPITEDLTLAITWIDTSTNTTYSCIGVTYNDGSEYGITVNALTEVITPGEKLYEHRIVMYTPMSTGTEQRLQFSFCNSISTPYLTEGLTEDELYDAMVSLYNAILDVLDNNDNLNSNIPNRLMPCIQYYGTYGSSCTRIGVAFRPTKVTDTYIGYDILSYVNDDGAEFDTTFDTFMFANLSDENPFYGEDAVRKLSDGVGTSSVTASTTTDSDGNIVLVLS